MQVADFLTADSGFHDGVRSRKANVRRTPSDLARRLGARSVHFDLLERAHGGWGWTLRNAYGEEVARSHVDYVSQIQASAAAVAFSRLVAEAGRQVGGR